MCSVADPPGHRLHQFGVWNPVEVAAEVCIDDFFIARVDQFLDLSQGVQWAAFFPIGVLLRLQVSLENRLEDQNCRRLHDTVIDRGHA